MTQQKEYVAVFHGRGGTWKTAYLSAASLAQDLIEQTKTGASVATVYQRDRKTYSAEKFPELTA